MALPDAGNVEDYTQEEMAELLALHDADKTKLTKNQKAAVARYNFKKTRGEPLNFRTPGAAPAAPAPTAAPAGAGLPVEIQALMAKDPATLTKDEKIAIAKAKSQAAKAAMAAKAPEGAAPAAEAKKEKSPEEFAREKALALPLVQRFRTAFPSDVVDVGLQTDIPQIHLNTNSVLKVLRAAKEEFGFDHLACLTAIDYPPDRIEVVYNLYGYGHGERLSFKTKVPRELETGELPSVPSVVPLWRGADWLEREVFDLFGVAFEGHPDLRRLLLPDGWVGYPLRKDYDVTREQFVAMDAKGRDVVSFKEEEGW
ncbi:MAG TPA: NADH-quinone oxidoreductase subunit C [Candidatus Thermoplasmatota archaeon]|nr:NADH-quinone oxidoreductase subunit C [Candidatus Thermoplasmatota archaeon]